MLCWFFYALVYVYVRVVCVWEYRVYECTHGVCIHVMLHVGVWELCLLCVVCVCLWGVALIRVHAGRICTLRVGVRVSPLVCTCCAERPTLKTKTNYGTFARNEKNHPRSGPLTEDL